MLRELIKKYMWSRKTESEMENDEDADRVYGNVLSYGNSGR